MAKADVVSAAKSQFLQDEDAAAQKFGEACYDGGASDQKASDGSFTQADIDAAVKTATDPLNAQVTALQAQDAADVATAQAAQAQVASLSATVDQMTGQIGDLTKKLAADDSIVQGLKGSLSQLQAVEAALEQLIPPTPPTP